MARVLGPAQDLSPFPERSTRRNKHDGPPLIVPDPQGLAGKPAAPGTRLSVEVVAGLFADGWSEQDNREYAFRAP